MSAFEKMTAVVVQEMDSGGNMIPARSIASSDRFCCLSLVMKRRTLFGYQCYDTTGLVLEDILKRYKSDKQYSPDEGEVSKLLCQDEVDSNLSVNSQRLTIGGGCQTFQKLEVSVSQESIPQKHLDSLDNRMLKKELPPSFMSISKRRQNLYLVKQTLKNEDAVTLKRNWKNTLWCKIISTILGYESNQHMEMTIAPKRVLVWGPEVQQLFFHKEGKMNIYVEDQKYSFPEEKGDPAIKGRSLSSEDSGNLDFRDLNFLKEKVPGMEESLEDLTEKEKQDVLKCLTTCLRDNKQLQNLEQRVFEVLQSGELEMKEDLADSLITCLFSGTGILVEDRAETIMIVLDALTVLSEEGLQLVDEILQKGALAQLKEQMESILEQNLGEQPADVDNNFSASTWPALYVVVCIMGQLSGQLCPESS